MPNVHEIRLNQRAGIIVGDKEFDEKIATIRLWANVKVELQPPNSQVQ